MERLHPWMARGEVNCDTSFASGPEHFYKLDEQKQAELVWDGIHIGERQDEEHIILLYKKDDLYIEIYLHKQHQVIKKFQAFSKDDLLDLYIFKTGFSIN